MKVGVLTHFQIPNFGANLQALSTLSLLQELGHEAEILQYEPEGIREKFRKSGVSELQLNEHRSFAKTSLPMSDSLIDEETLAHYVREHGFNVVIAGSDSIFRLNSAGTAMEGSF